MNEFAIG
jgi:hypothetical protein